MIIIIQNIKYDSTYYNTFTIEVCSNYHYYFYQVGEIFRAKKSRQESRIGLFAWLQVRRSRRLVFFARVAKSCLLKLRKLWHIEYFRSGGSWLWCIWFFSCWGQIFTLCLPIFPYICSKAYNSLSNPLSKLCIFFLAGCVSSASSKAEKMHQKLEKHRKRHSQPLPKQFNPEQAHRFYHFSFLGMEEGWRNNSWL